MAKTVLLPLLADGEFHSGQELADALGISRTAVWKQLKALEAQGIDIETARSRGYRIPGGIELLDSQQVFAALDQQARDRLSDFVLLESVDSTNAEVLRLLDKGRGAGLVCVAEQQTAGRGRRGREWVSPFATNLYTSLAWEFAGGAAALEGLSLAVGVAVVDALEDCGVHNCALKWPNDVLHQGAKLGGILIEMVGDTAGNCQVVVGVGLNVRMPATAAEAIDQDWTDIHSIGAEPVSRNRLLAALLNRLFALLATFESGGFAGFHERWSARDAFVGREVIVSTGQNRTAGTCLGVDISGALRLQVGDQEQVFHGGEISLRATD